MTGRISELRQKEVINADDGKRLGFVYDIDINLEDGKIEALVMKGTGRLLGFLGKDDELIIPWQLIKRVGEDIIIVDIQEKYLKKYI